MRDAFQKRTARVAFIVFFAALLCNPFPGWAGTVLLGSAQSYAVLGYAGVTAAGAVGTTQIYGNVGVDPLPLSSITTLSTTPPGTPGLVTGGDIYGPPTANQPKADITAAALSLMLLSPSNQSGTNLGGNPGTRTITPGVYYWSDSEAKLNGQLDLNATGNSNAIFVFQFMHAFTTASASVVNVIGGNANTEVYWVVGSQATLGSSSTFEGNILAGSSVVLDSTAKLCGRAFAETGSVTLIENVISGNCIGAGAFTGALTLPSDTGSLGFSGGTGGGGIQVIPEPGTLTLLGMGLGAGFLLRRKFRPTR